MQSLHSNLIVGPDGSNRLDDGDHLKGSRKGEKYFFDPTGGMYTKVSAIYREIFEEMKSVVEKNSNKPQKDRSCPEDSFGKIMNWLNEAETEYRKISSCDAEHDFDLDRLKSFSDQIWRLVKFKNNPFHVKRSDEYIITFKKTSHRFKENFSSDEIKEEMVGLRFNATEDIETDAPTYEKNHVADNELDQIMVELSKMYCKDDTLSVKGIFEYQRQSNSQPQPDPQSQPDSQPQSEPQS